MTDNDTLGAGRGVESEGSAEVMSMSDEVRWTFLSSRQATGRNAYPTAKQSVDVPSVYFSATGLRARGAGAVGSGGI